jgi:hypothetical protein
VGRSCRRYQFDRVCSGADTLRQCLCRPGLRRVWGIYIGSSLVWLWLVDGQRPAFTDVAGAVLAIVGALLILVAAPNSDG